MAKKYPGNPEGESWLLSMFTIPKGKARRNYAFSYESDSETGRFKTIRTNLETGSQESASFNFFRNAITVPSPGFIRELFKRGEEQNAFVRRYNPRYKRK